MKSNYFNYCALLIMTLLLISTIFRGLTKGKLNRFFLILLSTTLVAGLSDIFAVHFDNMGYDNLVVKYICHTMYLVFHNFTTPMYATYLITYTDVWHKAKANKVTFYLLFVPYAAIFILLLLNPWLNALPNLFYFDGNGVYTRGKLFLVLYAVSIFYLIVGLYYLIRYRKSVPTFTWIALFTVYPLMFLAVGVQYFKPTWLVEMVANAAGLLSISMMVQRPEEIIDVDSGAKNSKTFVMEMNRDFINEKPQNLIVVKIRNHSTLQELFTYVNGSAVIRKITTQIEITMKKVNPKFELYYLQGGCFVLAVPYEGREKTEKTGKKIREDLANPMQVGEVNFTPTVGICVMQLPEDVPDYASLSSFLSHIETRRISGENIINASDIINSKDYNMILDIENIIKRALKDDTLQVYYQPIWSVKEKKFTSAEALVRLIDPEYGFVPPDIFIPIAEKNGTIHRIGRIVFEKVCKLVASDAFQSTDLSYIEVNLSVVQCMNQDLAEDFIKIMETYGVKPSQINLELTETSASHEEKVMAENIYKLSEYGIGFSLDDFGTGYSNMTRIFSLPFSIAKLDKTFVNVAEHSDAEVVLKSSIHMLKAIQMEIVIEGIETVEALHRFSALGCDHIQGYYFSRPLPQQQFLSFLHKNREIYIADYS